MTPEDFAATVVWNGGVYDSLGYGLKAEDMDDSDPYLQTGWAALREKYLEIIPLINEMEDRISDLMEDQ